MTTPHESPQLDVILDALANTKRRGIIHELALRPATVGELARTQGLSLPAIHKHIRILEAAGLILRRKSGRTNFVALNGANLGVAQHWIMQYHVAWSSPHATLENYIAKMKE